MSPCLNFDIQVEILKRLPVKSLIIFRSVCKAWKSLIDSSPFIAGGHNDESDEHLMIRYEVESGRESVVKCVCFVDDDTFPQNNFTPPLPPIFRLLHPFDGQIRSSCGLVCLEGSLRQPDNNSETDLVLLWNPSIRKSVAIVVSNHALVQSRSYPFVVNFGVCPKTKDPKLLKISKNDDDENPRVMVFTLSSREWKRLSSDKLPRKSLAFENSLQTVIGRFLYQIVFDGEFYLISSFDLTNEDFGEVSLPDGLRQSSHLSISKLRESLVLIHDNEDSTTEDIDVFDVWMMMMEDGGVGAYVFTKLVTINNASVERIIRIMGFKKNGEPVVEIEIQLEDDLSYPAPLLVVYERCLDHITVKDLGICTGAAFFAMCSYNESLLLLDHDDGCIVSAVEN